MSFRIDPLVWETSTTTGTGALTLAGAVAAYRRFGDFLSNGDTTWYVVVNNDVPAEWEEGVGTWNTGHTLTRTTILNSSNADAAVSFSAGTKSIICGLPSAAISDAGRALLDDANAAAQLVTLGLTATAAELNYTDGVTSAIQTQLDARVRTLFATAIPMILPSSGSIGNNGALSGLTALPTTFTSCYMYFPAAAIVAGGAAGLYYVVMSSTTAGTIYNNTYTSGVPAIPGSPTAFSTTGPGAYTQTTAADITLLSYTVPGGTMGTRGALEIRGFPIYPNNANTKTITAKYGGTNFAFITATTTRTARFINWVMNVESESVQTGAVGGFGASSSAPTYAAISSASDQALIATGQLAVATDYLMFNFFSVGLIK